MASDRNIDCIKGRTCQDGKCKLGLNENEREDSACDRREQRNRGGDGAAPLRCRNDGLCGFKERKGSGGIFTERKYDSGGYGCE